jgi:S-adenosylmethionine-diacylglycerol 3-amino-3-carboxypropyl transferase
MAQMDLGKPIDARARVSREDACPDWVATAANMPVAFAQVREDATLDQWVVQQIPTGAEVLMVASGGCTAAALAGMPQVRRLHLVDPNPAQMALARLKLRLLFTAPKTERLALLGHGRMTAEDRAQRLAIELGALGLPIDALGPPDWVASHGPDYSGRYEILFGKLRETLKAQEIELKALLALRDPQEQTRRVDAETELGRELDAVFNSVMGLPNLVGLFGEAATRNRCEAFSRHFARRTRHAFSSLPAADNPYLWQMLAGGFNQKVVYPWFNVGVPQQKPEIHCNVGTMVEALRGKTNAFDLIHLSNILDWLSPEEARLTLELAWSALKPAGWVFVRQLNSNIDIIALGERFKWDRETASTLHQRDRSFFYRGLYLGRKK